MDRKVIFQAAAVAAIVGFLATMLMLFITLSTPGVALQPSVFPVADEVFIQTINEHTDAVLTFFTGDALFVLSYLLVFVGLYAATVERARPFAAVGLGAGIFTALVDAIENAVFITLALAAKGGTPATGAVPAVFLLGNLKWMAAFATLYAFGLVFPRQTALEMVLVAVMLIFPLYGVLGMRDPTLVGFRGLFFVVGMLLFAVYFWQRGKAIS